MHFNVCLLALLLSVPGRREKVAGASPLPLPFNHLRYPALAFHHNTKAKTQNLIIPHSSHEYYFRASHYCIIRSQHSINPGRSSLILQHCQVFDSMHLQHRCSPAGRHCHGVIYSTDAFPYSPAAASTSTFAFEHRARLLDEDVDRPSHFHQPSPVTARHPNNGDDLGVNESGISAFRVLIPVSTVAWLLFGAACILCINGKGKAGRWVPEWYLDSRSSQWNKALVVAWWLAVVVLWPVLLPVLLVGKVIRKVKKMVKKRQRRRRQEDEEAQTSGGETGTLGRRKSLGGCACAVDKRG